MSMPQSRAEINSQQIQKMLDENAQILKAIIETQNVKGKSMDIIQYQQVLHRNLMYLAGLADPNADLNAILPSPGSSNLLQSQRAPPPNQVISSQNMTPPPSTGMTSIPGSMGQTPPPSQWNNPTPPSSSMPAHNMKGYAPAPWLSQGNSPGMSYGMQQRMQLDEQRRRHLLRLHQERLMRARMQQQQPHPPSSNPMNRGMFPPSQQVPPGVSTGPAGMGNGTGGAGGGYMVPPSQPGGGNMGQQQPQYNQQHQPPQPAAVMQQTPPPPNMSIDM